MDELLPEEEQVKQEEFLAAQAIELSEEASVHERILAEAPLSEAE